MTDVAMDSTNPKHVKGTSEWGAHMRKRAKELARHLDTGYMELGEILWEVYDTPGKNGEPIYVEWGYDKFHEWAEADLNLHRRKAERLKRIWFTLERELKGLDRAVKKRLVALGESKMRELAPVLGMNNAEEWAEIGEQLSYPKLCVAIRQYKQKVEAARTLVTEPGADPDEEEVTELPAVDMTVDPDAFDFKDKHFYALNRSEHEVVEQALERAAQISHKENHSKNLAMICTDFLATNDFRKKNDPEMLARYVARLEEAMGLKFIVIDPVENRVVYGLGALEKLAKGASE
jgi:hypothetical protein